jgi:ABC-2 type transport system permease protein
MEMTQTATLHPRGTGISPTRPAGELSGELRAIHIVWKRELIRFLRARARIVTGLVQPVLFLFVLGGGLSPLVGGAGGLDFRKFVFPGVVAMSVVTTAIFSAVSIVWDREFGFLREMLVAPVSRAALVLGKALGGTTVAVLQGTIMLLLAPLVGIRLTPLMVVEVIGASGLMAFALTGFGLLVAGRIKRIESFQVVMQFALFPMLFLSGALFPLHGLPAWLSVVTKLDPVTYAVDPLRRAVFAAQDLGPAASARFGAGLEMFGRVLAIWSELAIVGVISLIFLSLSIRAFSRTE